MHTGKALPWQGLGLLLVWGYVSVLHLSNDGRWPQGDAARHAANGVFYWDLVTSLPVNPLEFALRYYARYQTHLALEEAHVGRGSRLTACRSSRIFAPEEKGLLKFLFSNERMLAKDLMAQRLMYCEEIDAAACFDRVF